MQEAARLSWVIHGNGYDNNIHKIDIYEYEEEKWHYISKNLAGSDVPWVTERKVF